MNWQEYIISNKDVLSGKPVLKGTRISVEHIVGLLAQGWSVQQILENYPRLNNDSIQAVFAFLLDFMHGTTTFNTSGKSV